MNNRLWLLLYTAIVMIEMVSAAEIMRKRKMLVRRKVPIQNSLTPQNLTQSQRRVVRPLKVIRKKIISSASPLASPLVSPLTYPVASPLTSAQESDITAVLSSPLDSEVTTVPPQSRPFSVKETVPPKPDAVKRCKDNSGLSNN